jgi:hypothetical protein
MYVKAGNTDTSVWRQNDAWTFQHDGYDALLRVLVHFMSDKAILSNVTYDNSGGGDGRIKYLDGAVGGVTEDWTISLTSDTAFDVVGGSTGAVDSGTVGVPYWHPSNISFMLVAGGTPFASGDEFVVTATENAIPAADVWIIDRWNPFDIGAETGALWWHGEGDGTQAIYCGIRFLFGSGETRNWAIAYGTGYQDGEDWSNQPGHSGQRYVPLRTSDLTYWISGNARRYVLTAKVSARYFAFYQGLFLPYGTPEEYPYPICSIACHKSLTAWDQTDANLNCFIRPREAGHARDLNGTDLLADDSAGGSDTIALWPDGPCGKAVDEVWDNSQNHVSGDHQLFPINLIKLGANADSNPREDIDMYGTLEGVRRVSGFGATAETTLSINGTDHVVFQNVEKATDADYWTQEMS